MLVSGGDSVGMLNRVGCRRSVVKADVSDSEVFSEGAALHEVGQPRRAADLRGTRPRVSRLRCASSIWSIQCESSTARQIFGQACRAVCVEAAPISRAVQAAMTPSDEFGDILQGQVHALAAGRSDNVGGISGQKERSNLHGLRHATAQLQKLTAPRSDREQGPGPARLAAPRARTRSHRRPTPTRRYPA